MGDIQRTDAVYKGVAYYLSGPPVCLFANRIDSCLTIILIMISV